MKNTNKIRCLLFLFSIFLIAISLTPSTASAVGYAYSVEGDAEGIPLSGFVTFAKPKYESDYIEKLISNNPNLNSIRTSFDIIDSCLINDTDNTIFSEGPGKLIIRLGYSCGEWENFSKWNLGKIDESWVEGDVYFGDINHHIDIYQYGALPEIIYLNNGMIFYSSPEMSDFVYLKLTYVPVPEPSTFILLLTGLPLFFKKRKSL